jgi:hypothetical protein
MLDAQFFIDVGANVRDRYRNHIFRKAKDINDESFKPYTSETYEQRKKAGKFKRFTKGDKLTSPVLSGDLLRDYSLIKTMSNGFQIGWTTFGARVEHLRNYGRVLTTSDKPLPTKVFKYLTTEAHKYIKKGSDKLIPKKTTRHKIGK